MAFVAALTGMGTLSASASEMRPSTDNVVVDGRTFGPEDGMRVVEESFELDESANDERVGRVWETTPSEGEIGAQTYWGASYAFSEHPTDFTYYGYAHAAGNVYNGERIIQVCMWFTQGTRAQIPTCSSATSNGSYWSPGIKEFTAFADSLDPNVPVTIFNIRTTRIDPGVV